MKEIPIAIGVDNAYVLPACVVIISLEKNKKPDTEYIYHFFCTEQWDDVSLSQVTRLKAVFPQIKLNILSVPDQMFKNARMGLLGFYSTVATYLRLFLPYFLKDIDKCIFLDADIVVLGDLQELYNIDITDEYVAGVRDFRVSTTKVEERKKILQIDSMNTYIYGGVLLMNLKKIREDFIIETFINDMEYGYPLEDQDIINKRFYGKIKKIPVKYNLLNRFLYRGDVLRGDVYSAKDIQEGVECPVIIHFPGERKPWLFRMSKGSNEWWKCAASFLSEQEEAQYRKMEEAYCKSLQFENLINSCGKRVVVWGCSEIGRVLVKKLKQRNIQVVAWGDNDKAKQGKTVDNILIVGVGGLADFEYDAIIITNKSAYPQIKDELLQSGIKNERIFRYIHKDESYYLSLTPDYYEKEMEQD